MEQRTATIPFDLETAKKINIGEIAGRIVTEKGRNRAEIVYEDNSSNCPLLVVIHSISVSADWFSATGKALGSENRLLLEVPEYTTFKDGDVLSNGDGSFIFILNIHGKYLTSLYASLAAGTSLNISDNTAANENHIECYRLATEFGKPEEILRSFDFTVAKMAYYKEPKYEEKEDDYFPFSSASIVAYEYKLLYHEKFFEHLHMKRLVIDENIPFPVSTWERSYRYKGYGYNMCRETKKKLLQALKGVNVEEEDVSLYTTGGWD
jgi:hypothetical protein